MQRKFRRVTGLNPYVLYKAGKSQVIQSDSLLGLTTDQDIWVDYSLADYIEVYEKEYGAIVLSQYDFDTPLHAQYKQKGTNGPVFLNFPRTDYVERRIINSSHPKIVVVYGRAHTTLLKFLLANWSS